MRKFTENMKIGTRMMAGFGTLMFLIIACAGISLLGTYRIYKVTEKTFNEGAKIAETANLVFGSVINISRIEKEILMETNDQSSRQMFIDRWGDETSSLRSRLDVLLALAHEYNKNDELGFLSESKKYADSYCEHFPAYFAQMNQNKFKSIEEAAGVTKETREELQKLEFIIKGISVRSMNAMQETRTETETESKRIFILVSLIGLFSIISGCTISVLISSSIRRPINELTGRVKDIAEGEGDLTMKISIRSKDETGILASFFNRFVEKIRGVVSEAKDASAHLNTASQEMNTTTVTFTENIREQAASAEEISTTVEEISGSVDSIATNVTTQYSKLNAVIGLLQRLTESIKNMDTSIQKSRRLSQSISDGTKGGIESVNLMTVSMSKITGSSEKISGIISIITGISDQINLLSLNAAIEAARAGDAGKGFAVVADEISKLAEQTSESVKEIDKLVNMNQEETAYGLKNVTATNETIHNAIEGISLIVEQMNEIFALMNSQIKINADVNSEIDFLKSISDEIHVSMSQQKIAFSEILKSIGQISELSQANAFSAQNLSEITSRIAELSQTLDARVGFFKV